MKAKVVSLALASAAIVGTGVGVTQLPHVGAASNAAPAVQTPVQTQTLPDFAAIAEANKGAVVNIMVTERAKPSAAPQIPDELQARRSASSSAAMALPVPACPAAAWDPGSSCRPTA